LERKQSIPEVMAQPQGRVCTIAKLSNYLVVILNDCADSHRIMIVAIVERHLLLLHALDGSMTSNPVEGIQGNSRGGSSITALEHFGIGKPSWSVIIKQSKGKLAAVNRDERVALVHVICVRNEITCMHSGLEQCTIYHVEYSNDS
jgi:hypothetical protein